MNTNRNYYRHGRNIHTAKKSESCPDCGREKCLTPGEIARGYHCAVCTQQIEGPQEPFFNEDVGLMEY